MVRRPFRFVLAATVALTGCSALLDVKDIYFDPQTVGQGAPDAGTDGNPNTDGGDGNDKDAATCVADLQTDVKNCGRCGHDCGGGTCTAGLCNAVELATVPDAPLNYIAVSGQHVFVSTRITMTFNVGGLWRVPTAGGAAELYADKRYAEKMVILGDLLYFVVDDDVAGTGTQTGGLYSCPIAAAAPCSPKLIAAADNPAALALEGNRVFYGDRGAGKGLMLYEPPGAPSVFRSGFGAPPNFWVDGDRAFYSVTLQPPSPPQHAKVFEALTDGGIVEQYTYDSPTAEDGQLTGDATQLLFTAYDFSKTTGGVVRRIPRTATGVPCDVGGGGNKRPYGLHADGARIYWSNQGEGAAEPYTKGSVVSCEAAGCCTTPKPMWSGDGEPTALTGDDSFIYFVTYAKGGVWKVAKP